MIDLIIFAINRKCEYFKVKRIIKTKPFGINNYEKEKYNNN